MHAYITIHPDWVNGTTTQEPWTLGQDGGVCFVPARGQTAVTITISLLVLTVHGAVAWVT